MAERARYLAMRIADNLQAAVQIAMTWDPVGPMACIAKLLMDVPPSFLTTTVATFKQACHAIHDAGVGDAMKSPLSRQAATFVFHGLNPAGNPQPADELVTALALAVRLEFTEPESALDTSALMHEGVSYEADAFRKTKAFIAGNKCVKLPDWYSTWEKAEAKKLVDKKAEKEAKEKLDQ